MIVLPMVREILPHHSFIGCSMSLVGESNRTLCSSGLRRAQSLTHWACSGSHLLCDVNARVTVCFDTSQHLLYVWRQPGSSAGAREGSHGSTVRTRTPHWRQPRPGLKQTWLECGHLRQTRTEGLRVWRLITDAGNKEVHPLWIWRGEDV